MIQVVETGAVISPCQRYRYRLWRRWDPDGPQMTWVMLNPSTADHLQDDPTIRRCVRFAATWGFGGFDVVNLFGFRATHPQVLLPMSAAEAEGPDNLVHVLAATADSGPYMPDRPGRIVVAAWGAHRVAVDQAARYLRAPDRVWHCLGTTAAGYPLHPLARGRHFVPGDTRPQPLPDRDDEGASAHA